MMSSVKLSLYFTRHNQSNTKGPFVDINGSWHSFLKPSRIHSTHGSPAGLGSLAGHIFWINVKLYQPLHCSRLLYIQIYIYMISSMLLYMSLSTFSNTWHAIIHAHIPSQGDAQIVVVNMGQWCGVPVRAALECRNFCWCWLTANIDMHVRYIGRSSPHVLSMCWKKTCGCTALVAWTCHHFMHSQFCSGFMITHRHNPAVSRTPSHKLTSMFYVQLFCNYRNISALSCRDKEENGGDPRACHSQGCEIQGRACQVHVLGPSWFWEERPPQIRVLWPVAWTLGQSCGKTGDLPAGRREWGFAQVSVQDITWMSWLWDAHLQALPRQAQGGRHHRDESPAYLGGVVRGGSQ